MWIFFGLVNWLTVFIQLLKLYWLYFFLFIAIIYFVKQKNNFKKSKNFLKSKNWFIVLDWKFEAWKTRFMTAMAEESQKSGRFVLSNFYNWYSFLKWNSLEDLRKLLYDVWLLWEYQNFTDEEFEKIYKQDWTENLKTKLKERKEIRKKYKYIPKDGYHNNFLIEGDEFQNYMFNRWAMTNFSGENKNLLKLFHQVRHFNSLIILWTQNSDELDVKFRRLSSFYINTGEKMGGLFFSYNVYEFITDKENNLDLNKAYKFTKVPVFILNKYFLNEIINNFEYFLNRFEEIEEKINYIFKRTIFTRRIIKKKFNQLKFHTKYNVNPDINTYTEGDLFRKLNTFYKNKNKWNFYLTNKN